MSAASEGVRLTIPVRWGDMDALGHVNNTVFFQFCESARIAYFEALVAAGEALGFTVAEGCGPGLVAANLNFRRQLRYPSSVEVRARCTRIGSKSFELKYEITDLSDQTLAAEGQSVCVWVDYKASKALVLPPALVEAIVALEARLELRPSS